VDWDGVSASFDGLTLSRKASRALLGWTAGAAVPTWFGEERPTRGLRRRIRIP